MKPIPSENAQTGTGPISPGTDTGHLLVTGGRLMAIRFLWLILVVAAIALWIVGTIETSIHIPACSGGACDPFALSAGDMQIMDALNFPVRFIAGFFAVSNLAIGLTFFIIGVAIAWRKSSDWMGFLVSFTLVYLGAIFFTDTDDAFWRAYHSSRPFLVFLGMLGYLGIMMLLFYFPDGRFVPRNRTARITVWMIIALTAPLAGTAARIGGIGTFPVLVTIGLGLGAQIYRYRRISNPEEQQQTKWIVIGLACSVAVMLIWVFAAISLPPDRPSTQRVYFLLFTRPLISVLIPFFPLTIAFSILRHRLWDVDVVINRSLVYSALTASIVMIYVLVVGALGALFQTQGNLLIALLATALIAVLFQPLRERLQRRVNRLIYGERDDPIEALSRLGRQMEAALPSDQVLPALVKTIAQTLKLPFVGITLKGGRDISFGQEMENLEEFPFIYQGETTGVLLASPRSPGDKFTAGEMRLLQNLARQAGAAVRNAQLTVDLQRSRQTIVTAREEERHRLRRDLHDGIGPTLAGLTLKLDAAKGLVSSGLESGRREELAEAVQLLGELKTQTQETVQNIRHIVHTLRPPSLDVLGLIPALQAHIGQVAVPDRLGIQMTLSPRNFPRLSPAVEVAAYRIVLEAVTNAIQHAQAGNCEIALMLENGNLKMEIKDDGVGLPKERIQGIGLNSMRERTEELGGRFELFSSPLGTRVRAEIPLAPAGNEE